MTSRTRHIVIACLVLLMISLVRLQTVEGETYESMRIYGRVLDIHGNPIGNATVFILDWTTQSYVVTSTDPDGYYNVTVVKRDVIGRHEYIVYAWHKNELGVFDYIPSIYPQNVLDSESRVKDSKEIVFTLTPAATIFLTGKLFFVLSRGEAYWYTFEVVDAVNKERLTDERNSIYVYGDPPYGYEGGGIDYVPTEFFNKSAIVIPADTPVYIKVRAKFYSIWIVKPPRYDIVEGLIDNDGEPFNFSQGESAVLDLRIYSYKTSIAAMREVIRTFEEKFVEMEAIGFFTGGEREDLRSISEKISMAERKLPPSTPNPTDEDLKVVRLLLEESYAVSRALEWRINYMKSLAQSHASFFPFFFAAFTVIFISFIFEDERKKIVGSLLFYPFMIVALYLLYPGIRLMVRTDVVFHIPLSPTESLKVVFPGLLVFLTLAITAIALILSVTFLFPRIYRPPEIEGKPSLRSIVSVIFSLGKRNVKRRKYRSILCMANLTILIFAFTALTSFSNVYQVLTESSTTSVTVNGVLIKKTPSDVVEIRGSQDFFTIPEIGALSDYGVEDTALKVENIPLATPILILKTPGRSASIYGVVGVKPSLEDQVTGISQYITGVLNDTSEDGIVLGGNVANKLGVGIGDTVQVYNVSTGGFEEFRGQFKVVGILKQDFFKLQDVNGHPFAPFKLVEGKVTPTSDGDTVMFTYKTALKIASRNVIGISRVFSFLKDSSPASIAEFSRRMALKGYVAWAISNGRLTKYYTGVTFEVKGATHIIVPLIISLLNVSLVFLNIMEERKKEISLLSIIGLNPSHITYVFLAESIVMGVVSGGIGYFFGLGAYRIMSLLGPSGQIGVREKLEWYWGVVGVLLSILVSVLSTIHPASKAVAAVTPSLKRIKLSERERKEREKRIFRTYHARDYTMPVKVNVKEEEFFFSYIMDRLKEMTGHYLERIENLRTEETITPDGSRVRKIHFHYTYTEDGDQYTTINVLTATKRPKDDYYVLTLNSKPEAAGIPETVVDTTVSIIKDMLKDWTERRKSLFGG